MIAKVRSFVGEVVAEMKKVSWTTRQELIDSTLVVFISSILLGLFVAAVDVVFSRGVTSIFK